MTFKIICSECGNHLYSGYDLKSARDLLKNSKEKCLKCDVILAPNDFKIEIKSKYL